MWYLACFILLKSLVRFRVDFSIGGTLATRWKFHFHAAICTINSVIKSNMVYTKYVLGETKDF